ncbi:hypothetical protein Nepgr_003164 [Nepenthes gracilis]|uniref:BHLH domain-containing protein n=1 Tax=Nepenthes gracilis TaxID=150966 RepID=A0AAD3RYZ6_NEPGR|nr:hypothetical protein Nepgr_003164 [Nepenthes gracilis]
MDPSLINEGSFPTANPFLAEIWPLGGAGIGSGGGEAREVLGLQIGSGGFRHSLLGAFLVQTAGAVNLDGSIDGSTVTDQSGCLCGGGGEKRKRDAISEDESSKLVSTTCSGNKLKESNGKRIKIVVSKEENGGSKAGGESSAGGSKPAEKSDQPSEQPKDYIHVRARRGQATDSHSLAERARREKISERMKILQDLVPGCNKVIGKALVLDEIINYIQSLQLQVEFLSMKLEAVNSGVNPVINGYPAKERTFDAAGMLFGSQATTEYAAAPQPMNGRDCNNGCLKEQLMNGRDGKFIF